MTETQRHSVVKNYHIQNCNTFFVFLMFDWTVLPKVGTVLTLFILFDPPSLSFLPQNFFHRLLDFIATFLFFLTSIAFNSSHLTMGVCMYVRICV